jgi:hypothetical protein
MSDPSEPADDEKPPVKAGMEEIPLDLSRVPTVEQGLADAAERYQGFSKLAIESFGPDEDKALFREHLGFTSFINRACSLHAGIVDAVKAANPHAAFTLLRAYLELVVTVYYLDAHPEYMRALERPMSELPKNTRKRFSELFDFAAREFVGVGKVYQVLNEMAHFGSTALWQPFTVGGENERTLAFSTAPHWRKPDDARTALAMLQESDEALAETLRRYAAHHVLPLLLRYHEHERLIVSIVSLGGMASAEDRSFTLPGEVGEAAVAAGLLAHCEEHGELEIADGVTPEMLEEFARQWQDRPQP